MAKGNGGKQGASLERSEGARRRVLVIEGDPGLRWSLEKGLGRSGYDVELMPTVKDALVFLQDASADAVILELHPGEDATFDAISTLMETPYAPHVICTSIDPSPKTVIQCLRHGASDFVLKPFSMAELRGTLSRVIELRGRADGGADAPDSHSTEPSLIVGVGTATQELRRILQKAAQTDLNCLIRGESGVGKDIVAREIHRLSPRRDNPFVKVNCGALPENLLESELFGYEKGAFTGADTSKPGRFILAHTGTIFLDEIGDMHPYVQAKILQVIEHKEFTKLGGGAPVNVDVQIIAATNANLEQKIANGSFRDDLYFRLNEVYIWVPPLSERQEDIPLLVNHFLRKHGHYAKRGGETHISGDDLQTLTDYEWPGNVRELESTIKRWLALGKESFFDSIGVTAHPNSDKGRSKAVGKKAKPKGSKPPPPDPEKVFEVLELHQWNRRKAASVLGISYPALRRCIEKHGLDKRQLN